MLDVKAKGSFDNTDRYAMEISAASKTFLQVRFSLITEKSLIRENVACKLRKRIVRVRV